jgi:hypothetical protein
MRRHVMVVAPMRPDNRALIVAALFLLAASCSGGAGRADTSIVTTSMPATAIPSSDSGSTQASSTVRSTTSGAPPSTSPAAAATVEVATPSSKESPSTEFAELPQGATPFDIDPAAFTIEIDNPYWPMRPGTRWTYREIDSDGDELTVVVVVTTQTKLIANGVTARVVRDTVTRRGEIIEDTLDWYAQDSAGNLWYLGEDTAEFEGGVVSSTAGSWQAGVDGALPGVIVPADPRVGMKYRQEYYAGEAEDNGEVLSLSEVADVTFGHFDSVMMTADTSGLEPDVLEHKFYAAGVGPVLTIDVGGGGREELLTIDTAQSDAGTGPLGSPNP